MERLIYFSGVHGSGKSTLIRTLAERNPQTFVRAEKLPLPPLSTIEERQFGRHCRQYLQVFYQQQIAQKHPDKHILCDRSCYDAIAYLHAFQKLGWVDKDYAARMQELHGLLFKQDTNPHRLVFVNPPLDFVKYNVEGRWKETGKVKWNETDFSYLAAVHESYQKLFSDFPCDVLELKETNLEDRVFRLQHWHERQM